MTILDELVSTLKARAADDGLTLWVKHGPEAVDHADAHVIDHTWKPISSIASAMAANSILSCELYLVSMM
jgi:hypothetical protein